jgi:geranylgeranyl diphosphate synthase type 3
LVQFSGETRNQPEISGNICGLWKYHDHSILRNFSVEPLSDSTNRTSREHTLPPLVRFLYLATDRFETISNSPFTPTQMSITIEQKYLNIIKQPYEYVTKDKGKEIRVKLIEAFNKWIQLDDSQLETVKNITQKLHNASLLIDDIEDSSLLRRGNPCAHRVYGTPTTINTGNLIYFEALRDTMELGSDAVNIFTKELIQLHLGQGMDIHWRDHAICPTEEEYLHMVCLKTGGLFRLSTGLMQVIGRNHMEFVPLVDDLSILFQILDDYLNLQSTKYHQNKSFCEDLTEGKFSFPIIHHIQLDDTRRVLNILAKRTDDGSING